MTTPQLKRRDYQIIGGFLFVFLGAMGWLLVQTFTDSPTYAEASETFQSLHAVYAESGVSAFLEAKTKLKSLIASNLTNRKSGSREASFAQNVAVYLFPELLPKTDFERSVAETRWAPLEAAIEKKPRSMESRQAFDQLRTEIWSYENPTRSSGQISQEAKQVIQIYEALSAH